MTWCTGWRTGRRPRSLLTTHDLDEAEKLADRGIILSAGAIIAGTGPADELARRMSTEAEVRWSRDGQRFVHSAGGPGRVCPRAVPSVRRVGRRISEVSRASLEETPSMALVRQFEQ